MKKTLLSFMAILVLCSVSSANILESNQKMPESEICKTNCPKENCQENDRKCDKCLIDDDEYCIYNQCFFDKHYRKMKAELCLAKKQETCIDNIYKNFKSDLERTSFRYRTEKTKLLEMIECDDECYKKQVKVVKKIQKEVKEKIGELNDDIKEQLCKNQKSAYRKFKRCEKRKFKKLAKYAKVYKFPCVECAKRCP